MSKYKFIKIITEYPPDELVTYKEYRGKPYFSIMYEENGETFVGFGTYKIEVLSSYLRDYFIEPEDKKTWNNHDVACLLAEIFNDPCACNYNGNDEWLPQKCDFADKECPNVVGVACWEQFLKHRSEKFIKKRNGKWIHNPLHNTVCSVCGGVRRDSRFDHVSYCNKCGAKMEEE